ncbi:MAG: hypothetical protein ACLT2Z_08960 [Eubacterium sp.]
MNRITSDIKIVTDGITSIIPNMLYFITFLGAFIVLIVFDWKLPGIYFMGVVISAVTLVLGKIKSLQEVQQKMEGTFILQEAIRYFSCKNIWSGAAV